MRTFALLLLATLLPGADSKVPFAAADTLKVTTLVPGADSKVPFGAADILKVTTLSVLDLSDDGRRVAVAARRLEDNAEVDNLRYGDPTYLSPAWVRLLVVDTGTGATQAPFKELVNVQRASWSHDSRRLAILTAVNGNAPGPGRPGPDGRSWQGSQRPHASMVRRWEDVRVREERRGVRPGPRRGEAATGGQWC